MVSVRLRVAVKALRVGAQTHESSYDRDRYFGDWVEQGDGCDTRAVVLKDESRSATTQSESCVVLSGRWKSYYDAKVYTDPRLLQIDHVVPVKNVWLAGGWDWTQSTRVAYYNDLDDPRTLVAVDAHDNESKGDRTPDEWLLPANHCRYVREFVSVKLRWDLTVTRAEKSAIKQTAQTCRNAIVSYQPADVQTRS